LHPFVDNQCCAAISRLQHQAQIPNSWRPGVAGFPMLDLGLAPKPLEYHGYQVWHGSCSVNTSKICQWSEKMEAQENRVALPLRPHTILGVCEAIGEDFGFNPVLLRVPFAASVLWSPMIAIAAYFVLGVAVLASRLLFPRPKSASADAASSHVSAANEQRELANAA
jgi:phage shock protein PspC (stress-responsive transcriptional regulator)